MKYIRSILRLTPEGLSVPAISERLGLGKTSVATYQLRARQVGLVWPCPERREEKQKRRMEASTFAGSEWTPYKVSQIATAVYFINTFDCYWTKVQLPGCGARLSRYETRRDLVREAARQRRASRADVPKQAQKPILDLLRYYISIRKCMGAHYDPAKVSRDAAKLVDRLADLWRGTMAISEPRSRFVTARAPANRPACPDSP